MNPAKPIASLSLDLDNQWSYMKTHGDPEWQSLPSYLDLVVPRVLHFLQERKLTITFFVVGQDAALERNAEALKAIAAAGHEIGNHSFHHEPWLHLYSEEEIETELRTAEEHIESVTGQKPVGFRGPGFSVSPTVLKVLARRGYQYDASTLPTFIGPLARAYYFMTAKLNRQQSEQRKILFGTVRDGLRPIKPYRWRLNGQRELVEIPVTTMPGLKTPIHFSYMLYLAGYSRALAVQYFKSALRICRWTGTAPSLLLHPLDFLGCDDVEALAFFPAMGMRSTKKLALMADLIDAVTGEFTVVTMQKHTSIAQEHRLNVVEIKDGRPSSVTVGALDGRPSEPGNRP